MPMNQKPSNIDKVFTSIVYALSDIYADFISLFHNRAISRERLSGKLFLHLGL